MKYLKALGLAAVAAIAMMGFSAGTASADGTTKLCANAHGTTNDCPTGKAEPGNNVHIEAESTNFLLSTNITNYTCTKSITTWHANTSTPVSGTTITGQVTDWTLTGCKTSGGTNCTYDVVNLPYDLHITGTVEGDTDTSSLTLTDDAGMGWTAKCGFVINCTFTTSQETLHGLNGSPTVVRAENITLTRTGGLCPATAKWDADYKVLTPAGLAVR